jgi:hypothetical protein
MMAIIAVVKNIPKAYLKAYENSLSLEVSGFSISQNQCKNIFMIYLLKNCIRINATKSIVNE